MLPYSEGNPGDGTVPRRDEDEEGSRLSPSVNASQVGGDVNLRADHTGHVLVANGSPNIPGGPAQGPDELQATSIRSINAAGNLRGEGTPNVVRGSPAAQNTGGQITTAGDIPHPDGTHMPIGQDLEATHSDASGTAPLTLKCNRKCKGAEKPIAEFTRSRTGVACDACLELDRVYYKNTQRNKAQKAAASAQPAPPRVQLASPTETPARSASRTPRASSSGVFAPTISDFRRVLRFTGIDELPLQQVSIMDLQSFLVSQERRTLRQLYTRIDEATLHDIYRQALEFHIRNGGGQPEPAVPIARAATDTPVRSAQAPPSLSDRVETGTTSLSRSNTERGGSRRAPVWTIEDFRRVLHFTGIEQLPLQQVSILDLQSFVVSQERRTLRQLFFRIDEATLHDLYRQALEFHIRNAGGQPESAVPIATRATGTPAQEPQAPVPRVQHTVDHQSPARSTISSQPADPSGPSTEILAEFRLILRSTGIERLRPQEVVILDMASFMVSQHHRRLRHVYPSINVVTLHQLYCQALQYYIANAGNIPEA